MNNQKLTDDPVSGKNNVVKEKPIKTKRILTISGPVTRELVTAKDGINQNSDRTTETSNVENLIKNTEIEEDSVGDVQPENKVGTLFKGKVSNRPYSNNYHKVSSANDYRNRNSERRYK